MKTRYPKTMKCLALVFGILLSYGNSIICQTPADRTVSILYTGKSLGVLGYIRYQKEHELLTETAVRDSISFKLVSHLCWRAKGVTIFLPSDEPEGHELADILAKRSEMIHIGNLPALRTDNVLMFQDPKKIKSDLLQMIRDNERSGRDFPDLTDVSVNVYETKTEKGDRVVVAEESGAQWPDDILDWVEGEVNRIDLGKGNSLFELPVNYGYFGNRATLLKQLNMDIPGQYNDAITLDLGHRNGNFDMPNSQRATLDFMGLSQLGYQLVVPFEFDLSLGSAVLSAICESHPGLELLASNVRSDSVNLLKQLKIVEIDTIKLGLLGLVDPTLQINLPRKILDEFEFLPLFETIQSLVDSLLETGVDAIIALSNMEPDQNALLADRVRGIDVIAANLTSNDLVISSRTKVEIPDGAPAKPGRPYLLTNNKDYGSAIGQLDLNFHHQEIGDWTLESVSHQLHSVNDRIPPDTVLMRSLNSRIEKVSKEKGDLMFPAFIDIVEQKPILQDFDNVTKNGRVSKELWEHFLAKLIRSSVPSEISIIRKVPNFLPLIGKLHEREVRSWLWVEDEMVLLDLKGNEIVRLMESELGKRLVTSGVHSFRYNNRTYYTVMGRWLINDAYYRVATTNVIYEGVLNEYFVDAIRVRRKFEITEEGALQSKKDGQSIQLRDYVISELGRIRSYGKGKVHHANIAGILLPDPKFERLVTFQFLTPTLWSSLNRVYKGDGYESVPESRISANNSFVLGTSGGFMLSHDALKSALDWTVNFGYARISTIQEDGAQEITENMDDLLLSMSYRYKGLKKLKAFQPFLRGEYDTEFSRTLNKETNTLNPRQSILRGIMGITRESSKTWRVLEAGLNWEFDFATGHAQYGVQLRSVGRFPLDNQWRVVYSLTNSFDYYFPTKDDTDRELSIRYNMINELFIPLFGEVSLSVSADFFVFKGKLPTNNDLGMSMLFRLGVTYNRIWKPRFQRFL